MKSVYEAANSADAHLVKNLLAQADINTMIRGEYLQGGLGDLPVGGLIQVCVADGDFERARDVIREWQQTPVPEDDDPRPPAPNMSRGTGIGKTLLAMLIGAVFGGLAVWAANREPTTTNTLDHNGDGRADEQATFDGDLIKRIEYDRNFDGKPDEIYNYKDGIVSSSTSDNDFDGRPETVTRFLHGSWRSAETDHDGDGVIEYRADAINGVLYSEEWLDASERVIKRLVYKDGQPDHGEIDTDGDGAMDTSRRYNALVEIESSTSIKQ